MWRSLIAAARGMPALGAGGLRSFPHGAHCAPLPGSFRSKNKPARFGSAAAEAGGLVECAGRRYGNPRSRSCASIPESAVSESAVSEFAVLESAVSESSALESAVLESSASESAVPESVKLNGVYGRGSFQRI